VVRSREMRWFLLLFLFFLLVKSKVKTWGQPHNCFHWVFLRQVVTTWQWFQLQLILLSYTVLLLNERVLLLLMHWANLKLVLLFILAERLTQLRQLNCSCINLRKFVKHEMVRFGITVRVIYWCKWSIKLFHLVI